MAMFTPEELEELARVDAELDAEFCQTQEKIAAQKAAYREANKEKIAAQQAEYYQANKEKYRAYMREYMRKRRANKKATPEAGTFENGDGV